MLEDVEGTIDMQMFSSEEKFRAYLDKQFEKDSGKTILLPARVYGDISQYITQPMINCEKCDARCCIKPIIGGKADGTITVLKEDLYAIRKMYGRAAIKKLRPLLGDTKFGRGFFPPCPFCVDNRCQIYNARPYVCHTYPFTIRKASDENGLEYKNIMVDPDCPQAVGYAKTEFVNYWKHYKNKLMAKSQGEK